MTCKYKRPTSFTCDCGAVVSVAKHGPVPSACPACSMKRLAAGVYVSPRTDPRELGPERPLLGWTEEEHLAWRKRRAVQLYQKEPELRLQDIAERLGVTPKRVGEYLCEAGISVRADGRDNLPAGPPVE